jgi:hypothetical protein
LLPEVPDDLYNHFDLELVPLRRSHAEMFRIRNAGIVILRVLMINEHDCILQPSNGWARPGARAVGEVWVSEVTDEGRNFASHAMLFPKGLVGVAFYDKPFEQRPIEIVPISFFYS